ncbi:IS110 family transposase, partial [Geobacillus stearothermophilus]|nr:IS110 family transposase [Geobacillus stearothermophilus]
AKYHRIAKRRGANRASVAVGRTILEMIYYILTRKEPYRELGADYWDRQREARIVRQTVKRLEGLGYEVKLEKTSA